MFETHCTITFPQALPLDFRVMRSAAVQEISWVSRTDWGQTAQLALPSYLFKDRFLELIKSHKIKRIFQDSSWWPQQEAGFAKGRRKSCWVLPSFQNYVLWIEEPRWKLNIDFFLKNPINTMIGWQLILQRSDIYNMRGPFCFTETRAFCFLLTFTTHTCT